MREHFSSNLCDSAGVFMGLCFLHLWFPPESACLSPFNTGHTSRNVHGCGPYEFFIDNIMQ